MDAQNIRSLWLTQGLANRTKHFEAWPSQSKSTVICDISVSLPEGGVTYGGYRVFDEKSNSWINAVDLAKQAIDDWKKLLRNHGF